MGFAVKSNNPPGLSGESFDKEDAWGITASSSTWQSEEGGGDVEHKTDLREVGLICRPGSRRQLLTNAQMFCHCPAGLYTETHDDLTAPRAPDSVRMGEYDGTALMEFKTKKNIIYLLHQR